MKHLASILAALCLLVAARAFAVTVSFTLPSAATTSAGIYDANGVLVRTLWSSVHYNAGTYSAQWNGLDDMGVLRPNGSYQLRVLRSNVQYTWEGVVGNTSDNFTGPTVHHSPDAYFGMALNGTSIYLTSGYQEQVSSAFKTTTTNPQQLTKQVLGRDTNLYHVVTDGTNLYWSARDPHASLSSFVLVTKASDDTEASLSGATQLTMTWGGRTYTSVIDHVSGTGAVITGLAVQKTGTYLFVSRRALNRLDVLNKTTGALVQTLSVTAPGALTVDADDNLWMVTSTNLVTQYSVATNGTLTSLGGITSGLSKPLALAVSPNGSTLAIADAGDSQQVKGYSTGSYALQWTMGQAGGYANGPAVTNDKFFFRNTSSLTLGNDSFSSGGEWAYLAYQPDGKLWVGDPGNSRTLRFDTDRSFVDRIQFVPGPGFYSARVDQNDPTRVFAQFLEFSVDYSKPLAPGNGSWTLVRNWAWNVPLNYTGDLAGLRTITTLPAYGRTFALIRNFSAHKMEVIELPSSGNVRFTGVLTDSTLDAIDSDGALRTVSHLCDWPTYNPEGTRITWKKRSLTELDSSNNPVWASSWSTVATSPVLSAHEVCNTATWQTQPWEITSTGVLLAFEDTNDPLADWHMQGLDVATGQWKWRAAPATNSKYAGPYPSDGAFDVGNNSFSSYAGGSYHASGRQVFWEYHGEGWKGGQTNKWVHLYDDGLVVGQFGVVSPAAGNPALQLPEAAAEMAGNAFISTVVAAPDGSLYIYHGDESWHGGVHRWHVTGLDSIQVDSISVPLANSFESGLQGTYYDDKSLSSLTSVTTRIDPTVDLDLDADVTPSGTALTHSIDYSVRWQGFVKPRYTETYTFYVRADDGVRLWVNNVLLIDKWTDQTTEWSGTLELEADELYQLRLEYYQNDLRATAQLSWSSASQAKEIVPSSRLFFTNVAPTSTGLNLHDALWYEAGVGDGLYGWHRTPAQDVTNDSRTDWWVVDTGGYAYRKDRPADIRANFARPDTGSVSRDLRAPGAGAVSTWALGGQITFGPNYNRNEYGDNTWDSSGQYLEVLDDTGKIIARLYPRRLEPSSDIAIHANTASSNVKVVSLGGWIGAIAQTPTPFTIGASGGKLTFTFADGSITNLDPFDPAANWQKPTALRMFFYHFHPDWSYPTEIGLSEVIFATTT